MIPSFSFRCHIGKSDTERKDTQWCWMVNYQMLSLTLMQRRFLALGVEEGGGSVDVIEDLDG